MEEIDKWVVEQCGIEYMRGSGWIDKSEKLWRSGSFSIKDPRCREIVREHFRICTDISAGGRYWCWPYSDKSRSVYGETIAEAEIACITAIWEASK